MALKFLKRIKKKAVNVFKRKPNKEFAKGDFNENDLEVDKNATDFKQYHQIKTSNDKRIITSCFAAIRKRVSKKSGKNQNVNDENVCSEDSVPVPVYPPSEADIVTPGTFGAKEYDFDQVQKELPSRKLESDDEISIDEEESSSGSDITDCDDSRELNFDQVRKELPSRKLESDDEISIEEESSSGSDITDCDDSREPNFYQVQKELPSRKVESDDDISTEEEESSSGSDITDCDDWREPKRPESPSEFVPELTIISTENAALGDITLKIHDLGLEIDVGDQTYNCWEDVLTMDPEEPMIRSWSVQFPIERGETNVLRSHFGSSPDINVQNVRIGIKRKFKNFKRKMDHVVRQSLYNLEDAFVENNFFIDRNLLDLTKYFN